VSGKTDKTRSRALQLVEADLLQDLRERASAHTRDLGTFQFAEAAARSLESKVAGHEGALRAWLSDHQHGLNLATLRMFHDVLEHGRQEYSYAAQAAQEAEADLDASRGALFQTLKRRSKLRDVRAGRAQQASRDDARKQASELDELWLLSRYRQP
jgi:hypothetical protein